MKEKINIDFFYRTYVDDLYSYARSMRFDQSTCMDAIHDVFYKICTSSKDLSEVKNIKHYLLRSLRNRLLDIYRTKKNNSDLSDEDMYNEIPFQTYITIEDEYILNEEDIHNKEIIQNILNGLTDRQREIIYLRYLQELDYTEISEIMQIPVHSCRKMISKTLMKIREGNIPLFFFVCLLNKC